MKQLLPKLCGLIYCDKVFAGKGKYCRHHRSPYTRVYRIPPENLPAVLNIKEVCGALRISRGLLNKYTRTNVIKEIRIGNTRRFLKTEVLKLIEQ